MPASPHEPRPPSPPLVQLDDTAALPGGDDTGGDDVGGGARRGLESTTDADDDEDDEGDWKAGASVVVMNDVDDDESADADADAADADADADAAADADADADDPAAAHKLQSQLMSQPVVPLDGNHEALINAVPPSPPSAAGTVEGAVGLAGVAAQQQSISYRPGAAATASASAGAGAPPPSPLGHLVTVTLATSVGADVIRDSVWYAPQQATVPPLAAATAQRPAAAPHAHPPAAREGGSRGGARWCLPAGACPLVLAQARPPLPRLLWLGRCTARVLRARRDPTPAPAPTLPLP